MTLPSASKNKPLGRKNYGSIGHLPGSRRGPADFGVPEGQGAICTDKVRDKHDLVIVQEKLDGSNVGIANLDGQIIPLGRAGYHAGTSPFEQHHLFADWVMKQEDRWKKIPDGHRLVGEWLALAHGTRYNLRHEPFVAFDLMINADRMNHHDLLAVAQVLNVPTPHTIWKANAPLNINDAMTLLGRDGFHGAIDEIEGAMWRIERKGAVDFLAKFVRPGKEDGHYLPELSGGDPVWNWRPTHGASD